MVTITVTVDIEVPKVPNFLLYEGGKMAVGDLRDSDLEKLADAWREALLERAKAHRTSSVDE